MRGRPELEAWGREVLASARRRRSSARRTSARSSRRSAATSTACTRCRPASTSRSGGRSRATRRSRRCVAEARRDPPNPGNANERLPDEGNAERLAAFLAGDEPTVVYFGKLLCNKGVHVLLEALAGVDARAVIVGFGDYRAELEAMATRQRVLFTGPLEHRHLVHLLALADACVVPSIFPEAFGMVAAEAAAAGCPPLVARHSGLAEVAEGLEAEYPPALRELASFATGDADGPAREARPRCSRCPAADRAAIRARRAVRRSSAGAGRASPSGCSRSVADQASR